MKTESADSFLRAVASLCDYYGCRIKNGLIIANSYGNDIRAEFFYDRELERVMVRR